MRRLLRSVLCLGLFVLPAAAMAGNPIPIDISGAQVAIMDSATIRLDGVMIPGISGMTFWAALRWNENTYRFEVVNAGVDSPTVNSGDVGLVGSWRIYSEYFYYDAGGGNGITPVTTLLGLNSDGTWQFGSSNGTWSVETIASDDWTRWEVSPYGPTRKIVLNGWYGSSADGPIEETGSNVDFLWVIYHVSEPDPGTVWMKFGS
jgi:hypothetical protein